MIWKKLGLIGDLSTICPWAYSHAAVPVPYLLTNDVIRVFITCLDERGRGRPGFVDLSAREPKTLLSISKAPVLDIGAPGSFDDNGAMAVSIVRPYSDVLYMYYAGFEKCINVRYRIFTGLAISYDNGLNFCRYSKSPILDRTDTELLFRCGPFVLLDSGIFKMWYVAGSDWTNVGEKMLPIYDLRYQESNDGINWSESGKLCLKIENKNEHGFGRPWIVKRAARDYQLFYSIRRRDYSAYRLGYAESSDGIDWIRRDDEVGLDVSPGDFDSEAIMYSSIISVGNKTYCFYNGNNFGEYGFGVAELVR
jgi:hypothetical protein